MMLSRSTTTTALLSLVLLQPLGVWGRWGSLPNSRAAPLLRHDFSAGRAAFSPPLLATVVGLKGGETKPSEEESVADTTLFPNSSDEISRGGSTLTTTTKRGEVCLEDPLLPHSLEETPSQFVPLATSTNANSTITAYSSTTLEVPLTTAAKSTGVVTRRKKDKFHKRIAKKLKNRNATNLRRKVMHASFGLFFAGLNHVIPKETFVPGMAVLSSATLVMELLRYRKGFGWMNHALHFVLGKALRKHEMDGKFTGSFYFFTGVTLTAALFPTSCATMGILQLAIADPSASYFGRATRHVYWSRIENGLGGFGRNKGILGFLGGALFCVPFNYRILSLAKFGAEGMPGGRTSLAVASLALGLAGAFADLAVPTPALTMPKKICGVRVPPFHLDDNFVVPVVSGFACTKILQAVGWQSNLELARFLFV